MFVWLVLLVAAAKNTLGSGSTRSGHMTKLEQSTFLFRCLWSSLCLVHIQIPSMSIMEAHIIDLIKATVVSCHRCLLNIDVEKMNNISIKYYDFDYQMSLSKRQMSSCNYLRFSKHDAPLNLKWTLSTLSNLRHQQQQHLTS